MNGRADAMATRGAKAAILLGLAVALAAPGCGGDDGGGDDGDGEDGGDGPFYAVSSIVTGTDNTSTGYISILDSLAPANEEVDLDAAYEFAGQADMWVHDGAVFVASGEEPTVTRFAVAADGELVEERTISFAAYGIASSAFWNNTFISETKAYMINDVDEYVIWNPSTMEVTGTLDIPALEEREGLILRAASTDRGNVVHDGRLYQPFYWSDQSYADRADDSVIAVFDVEDDTLVDLLEAPCPGLDIGTVDESGNLYFSNWTGGVGTHLVLGTAPNCVVQVETGTLEVSVALRFADVTEGREGAVFHYLGGGRFALSVFHDERVDVPGAADPFAIIGGSDWMLWSYDPGEGTAAPMESVWNSGAVYWFQVDGSAHALIPASDYASSTAYQVGPGDGDAVRLFDMQGYGIRLFRVR